ncbi:MAG: Uma2 family endonuclease [bacterium]
MGMPAIKRHWTSADVRALMDESRPWPRYELIDGELLVTPSPGWAHQFAIGEIIPILHAYLEKERVGLACPSPADLELRPGTITQPDVFVVPAAAEAPAEAEAGSWSDIHSLLLAIEVMSPSSTRTDRVTKREFYLDVGVPDYCIVDVDARIVERWSPERQTPLVLRDEWVWQPVGARTPLTVVLPDLFDRIADNLRRAGIRSR